MNTSCFRKEEKRIEAQWENTLLLPGCAGMPENIGLAGAYSGIVEGKLLVLGGANFPDKYPWEGGIKTWWATLYSYDLDTEEWTVYDDFLDRPLAYGVSISLPEGLLCIGGCDHARCSDKVFLIKKEIDSFVIDSVSYPSLPVPLANAAGAICDNCIYIAGGQESMVNERSTHHFYMLDLHHKEQGWQVMPGWDGPSLSYAVGVAQRGRFYLFSGRSYAPDELMTEYTEGYVFEPGTGKWNKMTGSFPVMAGTAIPYGEDKIFQRILHIVDDALLLDDLLTHLFCVKEIVLDIISLTVFGCKIGFVIHLVDGKITVFHKIYPEERCDVKIQRIFFHLIREFLHKVCDLFLIFIRKAYRKNICLNSSISNITIFFFHILQIICHIL